MSQQNWVPDEVLLDRPNVARMWDYFLGGGHNFAIDREAAEQIIRMYPDMPLVAQVTRGFLGRAVRFLASQGIEQFLDIGSGIPTANSVHEIAQRVIPTTRVAYVDVDPVAIAHSQAILQSVPNTVAVRGDARAPEEFLANPEVRRVLDFSRPIGVLAIALLHFVPDDAEAMRILRTVRDAVPSGSYLAMTHASLDTIGRDLAQQGEKVYSRTSAQLHFRTHAEFVALFEGFEIQDPGVVFIPQWRPETEHDLLIDEPVRTGAYAGVGRKP
jgi:hypothetical protein